MIIGGLVVREGSRGDCQTIGYIYGNVWVYQSLWYDPQFLNACKAASPPSCRRKYGWRRAGLRHSLIILPNLLT